MTETSMKCESAVPSIIGFGPAGFNAALGMRTSGYEGPIRVFSDIDTLPYSPILTSYYAAGEKSYDECFPWSQGDIDDLHLEIHAGFPVKSLDVDAQVIITDEGTFHYTHCVIATGAAPQSFGFPQDCGYEPFMLRTMEDAQRLKDVLSSESCRRVLVSGASMVALKMLEAALHNRCEVTLVGMNPHVLDFSALPQAAERFERGLLAKGALLRLGQTIKDVEVSDSGLIVTFSNGDVREFDQICVAHGMKCNLDFLAEGSLDMDRAILVDDHMRTSSPAVFAAGDVAQAPEIISGEKRIVGIWRTAVDQGACAGRVIASELLGTDLSSSDLYAGSLAANTISVDGTLFIGAGTMEVGDSCYTETEELEDMTVIYIFKGPEEPLSGQIFRSDDSNDPRKLVGFNIACDDDVPGGRAYDLGAMLTMRIRRDNPLL